MSTFVTVKLWRETRKLAKILAASLGESLVVLIDRLVRQEYLRKNMSLPDVEEER
jgi:hypothetical protein